LIEKFSSDLVLKIFIAITIAVEIVIQSDRDLIFLLKSIRDFPGKTRPRFF